MASPAGPTLCGTGATDTSFGTVDWNTPGNITLSDGNIAYTNQITSSTNSYYLTATNYSFAIPVGATIDGIEFVVRGRLAAQETGGSIPLSSRSRAIKGGTVQSTDVGTINTFTDFTLRNVTIGGSTELFGTTWTPTNINASTFGYAVSFTGNSAFWTQVGIDSVTATIYYTEAGIARTSVAVVAVGS